MINKPLSSNIHIRIRIRRIPEVEIRIRRMRSLNSFVTSLDDSILLGLISVLIVLHDCEAHSGVVWIMVNCRLQVLHLHNNHLTTLPEQLVALHQLSSLAVPFNRFITLPLVAAQMTHVHVSDVEVVSLAGNNIERLTSDTLAELKYTKYLDLRLNELTLPTTDTPKFVVLERLTHLDVRDNRIGELDIRVLRSLEHLNCERNSMVSLRLNGTSLRGLFAAENRESCVHFSVPL